MILNKILLIPAHGWCNDDGSYSRGAEIPLLSELDVIDLYAPFIRDELELSGVPYQMLNTRSGPGIKESERVKYCEVNTLVVSLGCGTSEKHKAKNGSTVYYDGRVGFKTFATDLLSVMADWGQCSMHAHMALTPRVDKKNPLLTGENFFGVHIEPFFLNGADVDPYLRCLSALGKALGCFLAETILERSPRKIVTYPDKPKKMVEKIHKVYA